MRALSNYILFSAITASLVVTPVQAEKAICADAYLDSIGINVHLHYNPTLYVKDFPAMKDALLDLRIRHIRDGLVDTKWQVYYDHHNELGKVGIKGTYVTNPALSSAVLESFPDRLPNTFEAYEAPNEYNQSKDPLWDGTLRDFLPTLYKAAHKKSFPVIGPSLTKPEAYPRLGSIDQYVDFGNMHNYPAGLNPGTKGVDTRGYASIRWNLTLLKSSTPAHPTITTEIGYTNDLHHPAGVPEEVSGKYIPRLFLEQWRAGIVRTFLYELVTEGHEDFGLIRADGTHKPAYDALANMNHVLDDKGNRFQPHDLAFTLNGATEDVHHLLLEKKDGRFYLIVWLEKPGYDLKSRQVIPVNSMILDLALPSKPAKVTQYALGNGGKMTTTNVPAAKDIHFAVTDNVTILELRYMH